MATMDGIEEHSQRSAKQPADMTGEAPPAAPRERVYAAVRPNTPAGQPAEGEQTGKPELPALTKTIVGKTPEGRRIMRNVDGSVSTERTITVRVDGKFVNIPTIFEGKQVSEAEALRIIERNHFVDPETKRKILFYSDLEEAVAAAEKRSELLGKQLEKMGAAGR